MTRKIFLFAGVLFAGLIAGGQYLVWWDYNPAGNVSTFYVEKLQYAIRVIGTPLFTVQILTALCSIACAILWRKIQPMNYMLAAAAVICVVGVLLTFFGNIPLLNQIASWNAAAPPVEWYDVTRRWWLIHNVRFAIQLTAFILLTMSSMSSATRPRAE